MKHNYQKICSKLLKDLPSRMVDIIERRFGLKISHQSNVGERVVGERETLEAIGESYEITRERVRQIEVEGLSKIKSKLEEHQTIFQDFKETLQSFGDLKREDLLLNLLGQGKLQNQAFFLLTFADDFERFSEDKDFYSFWVRDKEVIDIARKIIGVATEKLEKEKRLFNPGELFKSCKKEIVFASQKKLTENVFNSYLEISKKIKKNPEGLYGLKEWVEITPRGIKDKAYLVFKKEKQPLHFSQVAELIDKLDFPSERKAHVATVHNELIKDQRFVLVGRGLYALKEWGYASGIVKDIIIKVLKEAEKPLSKKEIIDKVLEQRFVKANTISLNLQDKRHFLRDFQGKYKIKEA